MRRRVLLVPKWPSKWYSQPIFKQGHPVAGPLSKLAVREFLERLHTGEQEDGGSLGGHEILQCHGSIAGRRRDQELAGGIRVRRLAKGSCEYWLGNAGLKLLQRFVRANVWQATA